MNKTRVLLLCITMSALCVLTSFPLLAQLTTGTLVGTVSSGDGALPGVTVTAVSPALQGMRTTTTNVAGGYVFPALPPGVYTVSFELAGMQRVQKRLTVSVSETSRADAELKVAAVSEELTVVATSSPVLETTAVSTNFSSAQINQLPTGRSIDDVTRLAPGVNEAGPNNQIVISGANSFDNLFLVDGVVVNENLRGQPTPLYIEDAIQETTVLSGGISAEFGRFTGGVVNTITKSGGNEFSGSFRDSLTNPHWTEMTDYAAQTARLDTINSNYEATFGGRILRDKLWFFGAARSNIADLSRQTTKTNLPYTFSSKDKRWEGKLTGQITRNQSLVATYVDSKENRENSISSGSVVDLRSLTPFFRPRNLLSINYNGVITSAFLLEGQFSRMNDQFTNGAESRDRIEGTLLVDDGERIRGWSPTFCGSPCPPKARNNKSWLGKGSYFLSTKSAGSHNVVGGYEEFHQLRNENNFQSGSDLRIHGDYFFVGSQLVFGIDPNIGQIEYDPVPALSQTSDFAVRSLFVNDKWELNQRWSVNGGLRYDKAFGKDQAGHKTVDDSAVSPRLAVHYDLGGKGHSRFSATYGKYVSKVDQGPADNTATAGRYASYYWDYTGPVINPAGTPASQIVPFAEVIKQVFAWFDTVGGTKNTALLNGVNIPGTTTRFDQSLRAPSMTEQTVGYGMTLGSKGYVRADAIYRKWKDFYVVRRTLATGKAVDPNGNTFDQGVIENSSDGLSRNYRGLQVQGSYNLMKPLTLGGNYTWSKLRGNVEGELPSFATTFTDHENYPQYTGFANYNPVGTLGPDMRHRANLWLQYDLPTPVGRLNLSLLERYHSALSYSAAATIDVRAGAVNGPVNGITNPGYQVPPSAVNYFFSERGAFSVDSISSTDLGLNFYVPISHGVQLFVEGDVLNMFDNQGIEDPDFVNQTILTRRSTACLQTGTSTRCLAFNPFTDTPVEGKNWQKGPIFGQPTSASAYQTPRTYRVSVGFKF
jgi:hypothetical protein